MREADKIKFSFLKAVLNDMEEEREEGYHVSEMVYDCMRRAYYEHIAKRDAELIGGVGTFFDEFGGGLDEQQILTFWIGKKLHELPMSDVHEFSVRWNDIVGRIDEIVDVSGKKVIVDKKTTTKIPTQPYLHHVKQVEYYSALLWADKGIEVNTGAIIYIDVANKKVSAYTFELTRDKAKILEELWLKKAVIENAIENGKIPEPKPSWLCDYCRWFERCVRDGY